MNNPFRKDCPCRQKAMHLLGIILFTVLMTSTLVYFSPVEFSSKLIIMGLTIVTIAWLVVASMVRLILYLVRP